MTASPAFAELKSKQRALRDGFHENLTLRVHRALSWLARAESCGDDDDARAIRGANAAVKRSKSRTKKRS